MCGVRNNAVKCHFCRCGKGETAALTGQPRYPGFRCHDPCWYGFTVTACLLFSAVQGDTGSCDRSLAFNISWYLRSSVCYNEVFNTPVSICFSVRMSESSLQVLSRLLIFRLCVSKHRSESDAAASSLKVCTGLSCCLLSASAGSLSRSVSNSAVAPPPLPPEVTCSPIGTFFTPTCFEFSLSSSVRLNSFTGSSFQSFLLSASVSGH